MGEVSALYKRHAEEKYCSEGDAGEESGGVSDY